jgi:predicted nucleic acid-binding protein
MIYLDTGCLVKLYYPEEESEYVAAKTAGLPIAFTSLHHLELTSAMRLKVFRQEATEDQVCTVLQFVGDDLASGKLIAIENLNSATIQVAIGFANQYSATTGCRSLDTLHCALAQSLMITAFLTTDARQLAMAKLIGLPVQNL